MERTRIAQWGLAGLLLVLLTAALPARAAGPGAVAGRLVNGTAGGASPAGAEVVLHVFRGEAREADRLAQADAGGAFRFDGLDVGDGFRYQVTATYAGVSYTAEPAHLMATAPARDVTLTVYETTDVDPGLRAGRALLALGQADAERQELAVTVIIILTNPSDRAFTPRPDGPGGPMGLVRFGLPAGARDLQPLLGLDPERLIAVDRGFASTSPLPPGEHEIGFTYRLPYTGERAMLEQSLPYGAGLVQVLVPDGGPEIAGPDLSPVEPVTLGGTRFRVWTGRALAAGTRLALDVRGLPDRPPWRTLLDGLAQPVVVPLVLGLLLVGGAAWAWRRRPAHPDAATSATAPLLQALADLDEARAAGRLDEAAYHEQRAALTARLRDLLAAGHRLPAAPEEAARG